VLRASPDIDQGDADVPAREGDEVSIRYATALEDGTPCESNWDGDPLALVLGAGEGLPTLEQAVVGLTPGMRVTVLLPPEEAYGAWSAEAIEEVPATLFGECSPEAGTEGVLVDVDGKRFPCRVAEISSDRTTVTVDFNHPLAGQSLSCDIELLEIISRAGSAQAN
jgi:FKBP-type peptidyl-prolyl cis-trans isomerase 2